MSDREVVIVGIDTRPIPMGIGGTVVRFAADPTDREAWADLIRLGPELAGLASVDDPGTLKEVAERLTAALAAMVIDEDRDTFAQLRLGLLGLAAVTAAYVQEATGGLPTRPS